MNKKQAEAELLAEITVDQAIGHAECFTGDKVAALKLAAEVRRLRAENAKFRADLGYMCRVARDAFQSIVGPVGAGLTVKPTDDRTRIAGRLYETLIEIGGDPSEANVTIGS